MFSSLTESIDRDGFAVIAESISPKAIAELRENVRPAGNKAGVRNLFEAQPIVRRLVQSTAIRHIVEAVLGPRCFAVQAILFDKTPAANWKVAWHQDLTIPVRDRQCVAGFTAWSEKEGVVHVQPPVAILERMLVVRVHLDDCGPDNGPLRVLPGSHRDGRLDVAGIEQWKSQAREVPCVGKAGDLLLMRPLLLHASSTAQAASQRRVLHLVFAAEELPGNLRWQDQC
jgi:ectoine hydroxylase-related dioxygenase (phytanoyl-CoA dioxygenase family)